MSPPAGQIAPIRLALPEHAIVVEPSSLPDRDDVRDGLRARFGHLEEFEERSDALLDTLDDARDAGAATGVALFALMAYGEGEDAVTVTMSVLSVDVSSFAAQHGLEADGDAEGPAGGAQPTAAQRELAEKGRVTTEDGREITAVKLPAGDALCLTAVRGDSGEVRIEYVVPRPGSTDAAVLAFHSRSVAYAAPLSELALRLARSLEFTSA